MSKKYVPETRRELKPDIEHCFKNQKTGCEIFFLANPANFSETPKQFSGMVVAVCSTVLAGNRAIDAGSEAINAERRLKEGASSVLQTTELLQILFEIRDSAQIWRISGGPPKQPSFFAVNQVDAGASPPKQHRTPVIRDWLLLQRWNPLVGYRELFCLSLSPQLPKMGATDCL